MELTKPSVSVCIPVFRTEQVLERCLQSIQVQTQKNLQIILVDDGSDGKDEKKRTAEKIFRSFMKSCRKTRQDFSFKLISHSRNLGLVEARRSAVLEAKAPYIYILDSDDTLLPEGLEILLNEAQRFYKKKGTFPHIIQGLARTECNGKIVTDSSRQKGINTITYGELEEKSILNAFLLTNGVSAYLIGKLFDTELYRRAFEEIPFIECTMNEEIIQFFLMAHYAKSYCGIEKEVFVYNLDSGMTSGALVTDLERWKKMCSSSAVFSCLLSFMQDHPKEFSEDQVISLKENCRWFLYHTLELLETSVSPEIIEPASIILEEYWGSDFIESVKKESLKP